jgi:glycosyltransferase involved in cell wall biosynthesis
MISVCIPSYNQQEYLPDCIESVLNQTYPKSAYEIIVVDDGSTDSSLELARKYPIKVISQVNKGLASARNTGIMNSNGDYIFFLDADDMIKENCIEKIAEVIKQTGADVIAPSFKCFGIQNNEVILDSNITPKDFITANRIGYFCAIKKSRLLECGGYSPRMIWGYEDYALWFDLFNRGIKMVVLQDVLVLYRTRENSMISVAQQHHEELMAQIKKDFPNLYE